VKRNLDIIPVSSLDEVLEKALVSAVTPIEWDPESEDVNPVPGDEKKGDVGNVTTH
jgi:ATP-dependent Lon protease